MGLSEDMLVLADMLPILPVLSMLPSVRLRLSQRLKLTLLFFMEDMAMVDMGVDMLDSDIPVLDMPDMGVMVVMVLDMEAMDLDMAVDSSMVKHNIDKQKLKAISELASCYSVPSSEV